MENIKRFLQTRITGATFGLAILNIVIVAMQFMIFYIYNNPINFYGGIFCFAVTVFIVWIGAKTQATIERTDKVKEEIARLEAELAGILK